jgi:transposase
MEVQIQTAQGVPLAQVARRLGIDRKTARKLRDAPAEPAVTVRRRRSRIDEHRDYIEHRLAEGVPAAQIGRDLAQAGTPIAYPTLRDFARKLRPPKATEADEVRFETAPAKQAQCDWAEVGRIDVDSIDLPLYLFVMILGYSRKLFAHFTTAMDELVLQRMHAAAFTYFGGVPFDVLYDNMRTVTVGRDRDGHPVLQREFADFAALYGFRVKCAQPYRPKTKGKVERSIRFLQTSFLPGRTFTDLESAQQQLFAWLTQINQRVHRTHGEVVDVRFAKEQPLLIALRPKLRIVERTETRVVCAEGTVAYRGNRYTLPPGHRGRTVLLRDDGERIRVLAGQAVLVEYPLALGKGRILGAVTRDPRVAGAIERTIVAQRPLSVYEELVG